MTISSLNVGDVLGYTVGSDMVFRYQVDKVGHRDGNVLYIDIHALDEEYTGPVGSYPFPMDPEQQKHWCIVSRREVVEEYV